MMTKRIFYFLVSTLSAFLLSYFSHQYILESQNFNLRFSLLPIYLFHAIAACLVYLIVEFIADKMPNQAGYAYLASVFLKMGFFVLIFNNTLFGNLELSKPERFSLIVPLFLFLILEALFISKLLNNK